MALQWSNSPIDLESDCLEAVNMIKGGINNKFKYAFIIREIISSMGRGILALLILAIAIIGLVMPWQILLGNNAELWFG